MPESIAYSPTCVSESDAAKVLTYIDRLVDYAWQHHPECPDPDIYRDAAMQALVGCLERWDSTVSTARFSTYAYPRLKGAIIDAHKVYNSWRHGRSRGIGRRRARHKGAVSGPCDDTAQEDRSQDQSKRLAR